MDRDSRVGHYRILGRLGAGGMGEVYHALDTRLEREVALKVLPSEFSGDRARVRRLKAEAKILASLNHANIASIYGIEEFEGDTLLVLEFVDGKPLDLALRESGVLPVDQVLRIGRQVASALEAAHAKGIIHRDLKPANVILDQRGTAKVLDFGIAWRTARDEGAPSSDARDRPAEERGAVDPDRAEDLARTMAAGLTASDVLVGTAPYMSPEQLDGETLDKRSDIWSFGCLLFELLTGRVPHRGETLASTIAAILTSEPAWEILPGEVPPDLLRLLQRCLRKDPALRLHDIADARIELDELIPDYSGRWLPQRRTLRLVGWVGLGLAAGIVGALMLNVAGSRDRLLEGKTRFDPAAVISLVALPSEAVVESGHRTGLFLDPTDDEEAYLTDALPATLSARLAALDGLETRLPPTAVELASVDGDLDEVADLYGVSAFVTSTVTIRGDTLDLAMGLIDARTRAVLWSARYVQLREGYLQLVEEAADGLQRALRRDARPVAEGTATVGATAAAELALRRGQFYASRHRAYRRQRDYELAVAAFEQALAEDPGLGEAAAGIALLSAMRMELGLAGPEAWADVEVWARRAQNADSLSGLAWAVQPGFEAWFRREGFEKRRLESAVLAASLSPRLAIPHGILGNVLTEFSLSLASEAFAEASRIEPLLFAARVNLVASLATAGRLEDALAAIEESRRIQSSDQWAAILTEASLLSMLGRTAEAKPLLDQLTGLEESGALPSVILLEPRLEYALATGRLEEAEALHQAILQYLRSPGTPPQLVWNLVVSGSSAFSVAGQLDAAFEILELGAARGALVPYDYLELNPRLGGLRADPRYSATAEPSRERLQEMLDILRDARAEGRVPAYLDAALDALVRQLRATGA